MAASRHKEEVAHLRGFIIAEDHEGAVVARIQQGASVSLAAMQLRTGMNPHRVTPWFSKHAGQEERTTCVNDFTATVDTIVAVVDVDKILRGSG